VNSRKPSFVAMQKNSITHSFLIYHGWNNYITKSGYGKFSHRNYFRYNEAQHQETCPTAYAVEVELLQQVTAYQYIQPVS